MQNAQTTTLVREITDTLWNYDAIKRVVNNNYVVLQSIVRNVVKSLGINADNFDFEAFQDGFDIHELDLSTQDTLVDSLSKVLSKFIIHNDYDKVDVMVEAAPGMIANRLSEVVDYLRSNPNDGDAIEYARELINQLREFNRDLARRYESELNAILSPKPSPKPEVKPVETKSETKVEAKPEPKPVVRVRANEDRERKLREIDTVVYFLRTYMTFLSASPVRSGMFAYWLEQCRRYLERLRELDPQLAREYERELRRRIYEKEKYVRKEHWARVNRAKPGNAKITEFLNDDTNESDKREWKRHVKGILKWITLIGI